MSDERESDLWFTLEAPADGRECSMEETLIALDKAGKLRMFNKQHGELEGDCHRICLALMIDLTVAEADAGWTWCRGHGRFGDDGREFEHSWMEFDGWMLEASNAQLTVRDALIWRAACGAHDVVERNGDETRLWVHAEAARERRGRRP